MSFSTFNPIELQRKIEQILGLNVTSKQFNQVMNEIELERKIAVSKKGILVAYPFGSRVYNMTTAGQVTIDFNQGFVKFADGTQAEINGTLDKCRSLLLFVNDADAIIIIDGVQLLNYHALWHLLEDIDITKLSILFPSGTSITPDQFNFAFVASDKPSMAYKNSLFIAHDFVTDVQYAATASRVTRILRHAAGYNYIIITSHNNGGADVNTLNVYVEYSADGTIWFPVANYNPLVLAVDTVDTLTITSPAHFYRVQISLNVAAENVDLAMQLLR